MEVVVERGLSRAVGLAKEGSLVEKVIRATEPATMRRRSPASAVSAARRGRASAEDLHRGR